jgi:hypothetical protein
LQLVSTNAVPAQFTLVVACHLANGNDDRSQIPPIIARAIKIAALIGGLFVVLGARKKKKGPQATA